MTSDEIRQLRQELQCTARELATTIGLDPGEVMAWEQGERFPTKKMVAELNQLRQLGGSAIVRKKKSGKPAARTGAARLADPQFWELVRKLLEHPELFSKAQSLAVDYADPGTAAPD